MKKRFQTAVFAASIAAAILIGVMPASADQPTWICTNIQPAVYPNLRNFFTHSHKIVEIAESTGIYACELVVES